MRNITRNNYTPHIGDYHNMIVHDEVLGKVWLFDCDGVFLDMSKTNVTVVDDYGESTEYAASQRLVTATKDALTERIGEAETASQERDAALGAKIDDEVDTLEQEIASVESESIARDNALEADYTQKYNTLDNDIEALTRTTDKLATDIEDINRTAVFGVTLNQNDNAKVTMTVVDGGATTNTDIRNASSTRSGLMTAANYNQVQQNTSDITAETAARQAADNNLQSEIDAIVASSDVKDIVGTKADLNNYDTSTLGNNDIIKVLQDESQNDETTYYRWSTATSSFSLIGAEGPYYTKSATDTLLAGKQNNLTPGTAIGLNNDVISVLMQQSTGQAQDALMSQKAITDALVAKGGVTICYTASPEGRFPNYQRLYKDDALTTPFTKRELYDLVKGGNVVILALLGNTGGWENVWKDSWAILSSVNHDRDDDFFVFFFTDYEANRLYVYGGYDGSTTIDFSRQDLARGLSVLSYGHSTWGDFIKAYRNDNVFFCRASSNSDPSSGDQTRLAFMAYVNNPATPTEVEFQYVHSVSNKSATNQVDQVFVYKLTSTNGGTWTVETRDMAATVAAGTNAERTYSNGTVTINPRLYTTTGQNTDGGVTQKLFTDTVGNIEAALNAINNGGNA